MTVAEMIARLKEFPQDIEVVLVSMECYSKDFSIEADCVGLREIKPADATIVEINH